MKKLFILFVAMVFAAGAMAQESQTLDVTVTIENYATLTVTDPGIELVLYDSRDGIPEVDDWVGGKLAELELDANYLTDLVLTSNSGIMTTHHGYDMVSTTNGTDVLGVWPQMTGPDISGQSMFSWDAATQQVLMDGLHREQDSGNGIAPGTHVIHVGISSNPTNTPDGAPASGTFTGSVMVTVQAH